ncbi:hypothetical protein AAMO2058_000393000 [Amorphochlora amoebiformis]|mmetsp:Transcript_9540/g.15115  ORF Transcript_9540/g.15115 Transcript_9540/m.15115 type:complete len:296 (-) Transcript_9540:97-984(-)|eukprot:1318727-Amorphochlora_amoeboformis.AAC.2
MSKRAKRVRARTDEIVKFYNDVNTLLETYVPKRLAHLAKLTADKLHYLAVYHSNLSWNVVVLESADWAAAILYFITALSRDRGLSIALVTLLWILGVATSRFRYVTFYHIWRAPFGTQSYEDARFVRIAGVVLLLAELAVLILMAVSLSRCDGALCLLADELDVDTALQLYSLIRVYATTTINTAITQSLKESMEDIGLAMTHSLDPNWNTQGDEYHKVWSRMVANEAETARRGASQTEDSVLADFKAWTPPRGRVEALRELEVMLRPARHNQIVGELYMQVTVLLNTAKKLKVY